ncbi:efflux RND transporter permease subunit [Agarivorans sp. TSD2052]|uniref:efflux RND transporter permease subunit n=1 Tax=Agarivorans sp. TSD2052 TaxID=2937286 RepID=UPI00200FFA3C|nr:efflux RND transporter permease subunit [Agarivorans sp. TSD2052]UPW18347.1 efflux RND transporter permease subunit [Agarivorans sp. TSD2052]
MGIAGRIGERFLHSPITPLLALVGLLMGIFSVMITPKEEEPQIDVTFADVYIPFPGASPKEVEHLVTLPAEKIISELNGIDTLYSFSQPNGAMLIVVFEVGVKRNDAIVSLYNQIYANLDKLPTGAGVGQPLIKPRAIDDVPIVSVSLWDESQQLTPFELTKVAHTLETELKRIPGTNDVYTLGEQPLVASVRIDPVKLNAYGVEFKQIAQQLQANNQQSGLVDLIQDNQVIKVQTGQFLRTASELENLVIAVHQQQAVYLTDVAEISLSAELPSQSVWLVNQQGSFPSVTIAIAKQAGENAVQLAERIEQRINQLDNVLIPHQVSHQLSRNYGATAADKANTLIGKLIFATAAVVLLVLITMGWREAVVVGIAIVITLAITLFASWAWGFTLNRVSLFALIFSIGILVDDAIVVVENIHRHMGLAATDLNKPDLLSIIPQAVDEVGGPTILATFTVIAALLPMAFVSGLMGPYMSPIPINASLGMLISLSVAFVLSPWLSAKLLNSSAHGVAESSEESKLQRFFEGLIGPFLDKKNGKKARGLLWLAVILMIVAAIALPLNKLVVMKMLPFDNKSEFQVMVDLPEGRSLEQNQRLLLELSDYLMTVPEVADLQLYAGTTAPINFNGLVRHYFMRNSQELGDIQVNLVDKSERERDSHSIAGSVRKQLQAIGLPYQANIKVVEVPPGPPVWSPIVAEVYGPSDEIRQQAANALMQHFHNTEDIVDIDIMLPGPQSQWRVTIDRSKSSLLGINYGDIVEVISTAVGGNDVSYLHSEQQQYPVPIRLQLKEGDKLDLEQVLNLRLTNQQGQAIPLSELVSIQQGIIDTPIMHKNTIPMVMVIADMAGELDSPLYGMFDMALSAEEAGLPFAQHYIEQPDGLSDIAILWDGEWKITYETFRDMGLAYAVGMIMIYLLVVAQFRSYLVPLIIMAPIPLTIIGVMPGHALLGAQFTATSMIGMIALAGIIVRNSILLVDFINQQAAAGMPFSKAVISSGAVRAKPIILTGLAAMIGALFILDDPIFNGLAISLIFGILVSTLLTLVVIPVLYFALMRKHYPSEMA